MINYPTVLTHGPSPCIRLISVPCMAHYPLEKPFQGLGEGPKGVCIIPSSSPPGAVGETPAAEPWWCCLQAGAQTGAVTRAQRVLTLLAAAAAASGHPSQSQCFYARSSSRLRDSHAETQWKAARGSTWWSNEHTLLLLHHSSSTFLLLPFRNVEYPELDTQGSPSPARGPAQDTLTSLPCA